MHDRVTKGDEHKASHRACKVTSGWESEGTALSQAFKPQLSLLKMCSKISGSTLSKQNSKQVKECTYGDHLDMLKTCEIVIFESKTFF